MSGFWQEALQNLQDKLDERLDGAGLITTVKEKTASAIVAARDTVAEEIEAFKAEQRAFVERLDEEEAEAAAAAPYAGRRGARPAPEGFALREFLPCRGAAAARARIVRGGGGSSSSKRELSETSEPAATPNRRQATRRQGTRDGGGSSTKEPRHPRGDRPNPQASSPGPARPTRPRSKKT